VDLTVILVNNYIYGKTDGQVSPTTPFSVTITTTHYMNAEYPLKIVEVVAVTGANYVARWTTFHMKKRIKSMKETLNTNGFSFIEIISHCPVSYSRRSGPWDCINFHSHFKGSSASRNLIR